MPFYQAYVRDKGSGALSIMATGTAPDMKTFLMQRLSVDPEASDLLVGQVTSFDPATGQATIQFQKVTISVSIGPIQ